MKFTIACLRLIFILFLWLPVNYCNTDAGKNTEETNAINNPGPDNPVLPSMTLFSVSPDFLTEYKGIINTENGTIDIIVPYGTLLTTLVANFEFQGLIVYIDSIIQYTGVSVNDFTTSLVYSILGADGSVTEYTVTVIVAPPRTGKDFLAFSWNGFEGIIDIIYHNVDLTVPYDTDILNMIVDFQLSPGATAWVAGIVQEPGTTRNDFSLGIFYEIVAEDGSVNNYMVTVRLDLNSAKEIVSFEFKSPPSIGQVDTVNHTVNLLVPVGLDLTSLVPWFTLSPGAVASIGGVAQLSGNSVNDFTNPINYNISAQDGSSVIYTITVTESVVAGANWFIQNSQVSSNLIGSAWSGSGFFAVDDLGRILFSADGVSWQISTTLAGSPIPGNLECYLGTCAVAGSNGSIFISTDHINWIQKTPITAAFLNDISISASGFIAVGDGDVAIYSNDMNSWSLIPMNTGVNLRGVFCSDTGQCAVVGDAGEIVVGLIGITWARISPVTANQLNSVTCSPSACVSVGISGTILQSPDGLNWNVISPLTGNNLNRVIWSGSEFITVGDGGIVLTSNDGLSWDLWDSGAGDILNDITWSSDLNKYIALGNTGNIFSSP